MAAHSQINRAGTSSRSTGTQVTLEKTPNKALPSSDSVATSNSQIDPFIFYRCNRNFSNTDFNSNFK